jgi:hypothetical protein
MEMVSNIGRLRNITRHTWAPFRVSNDTDDAATVLELPLRYIVLMYKVASPYLST